MKNKAMYLLIIITIISTASIICFCFGVYINYNAVIHDGESEDKTIILDAEYNDESLNSSIVKGKLIKLLTSLPDDVQNSIETVYCQVIGEDDIFTPKSLYDFHFKPVNGKIFDGFIKKNIFSDKVYSYGERVAKLGSHLYENDYMSIEVQLNEKEPWINNNVVKNNQKFITINKKEYEIIGKTDEQYDPCCSFIFFPFTSLDDNTPIKSQSNGTDAVEISFKEKVTGYQYISIKNAVNEYLTGLASVEPIELTDDNDIYYYKTIILISILVTLLSAINIAVLYRYIVEKDTKKINILRLCGCTRLRAIFSYLIKCNTISLPLFVLIELCYDKLILPHLNNFLPYANTAYNFNVYGLIFLIFTFIFNIILYLMLKWQIPKGISELREAFK